jgi:hypothetical protein
MRELLREVYDRLCEVGQGYSPDDQDPEGKVLRLRELVGEVLGDGLFDGRWTDLDMRQLPPVLR